MALFSFRDITDTFEDLLDKERGLLLAGEIEMLSRISTEKARLMPLIKEQCDDPKRLEKIRRKADRNQELMAAVARGIRTATQRLDTLRQQKKQLRTYNAGGESQSLMRKTSSFEKRS